MTILSRHATKNRAKNLIVQKIGSEKSNILHEITDHIGVVIIGGLNFKTNIQLKNTEPNEFMKEVINEIRQGYTA